MAIELTQAYRAPVAVGRMAEAARRFLASLDESGRAAASFPFAGEERYFWHYTPIERNGLQLKEMTAETRDLAFALLATGLSARANRQARQIVDLEPILRETEEIEQIATGWHRDSGRYRFSIFGEPGGREPWAWRAGGHHIGIIFTIVDGDWIAPTPLFLGANPAIVRHGEHSGLRILPDEEELARILLGSLDEQQKGTAIVEATAPSDILSTNRQVADPTIAPTGIPYADLTGEQRAHLVALTKHYVTRVDDELSAAAWASLERAGLDGVAFAWAGPEERGQGHYYAVKGPRFLIEYDNTQNGANHIHSVWRDFTNDFGEDLLAAHYADTHSHGDHQH
jgi:hypothetical protein